ncbi:MAG: FMN-binding protein, partial [Bacteroidetes bacterium]|nr:FMN-binding protein [Bacteroidota bacterium]
MIPEKMLDVLSHEGVVSIVSHGSEGPHVINTWNSYLTITGDERLIGPVGKMNKTESNVKTNNA